MDPISLQYKLAAAEAATRRARSATFWKVLVGAMSSAVLTTIVVASYLGPKPDQDRDAMITETSAAEVPAGQVTRIQTPAPSNTSIAAVAPATTIVVRTPVVEAPAPPGEPEAVTATPVRAAAAPVIAAATVEAPAAEQPAEPPPEAAPPPPAPVASAPPPLRDPRGNLVDPNDHGSNPYAPAMTSGAGQFKTDAPPWAASAFVSDPNAGAGPFTTEWNIPAFGGWGY